MKKFLQYVFSVIAGILLTFSSVNAGGESASTSEGSASGTSSGLTFNVGYMTEYWFRGAFQQNSSYSFGADIESGNFYIGTWWARVGDKGGSSGGDGMEYDIYAGYNMEIFGIPSYVGVTGYYYTDDWDRDYEEVNVGMDFGLFAIDGAIFGSYKGDGSNASSDYGHFTLSVPLGPVSYSYMTFTGGSLHSAAHELSYETSLAGFDVVGVVGANNDGGAGATPNNNQDTEYFNITVGLSF